MSQNKNDLLLEMKGLKIEGFSDEQWHQIVKDLADYTLIKNAFISIVKKIIFKRF